MKTSVRMIMALVCALEAPVCFAGGLIFDTNVPEEQSSNLEQDLKFLQGFRNIQQDSDLLRVMKLSSANPRTLQKWLDDRVQYILSERFDLRSGSFIADRSYKYENPDILPTPESASRVGRSGDAKVVMSNIGTAAYATGKSQGFLVGLKVPGVGDVRITSPRVGVLQIGEGLFRTIDRLGDNPRMKAYAIMRLGTLFHEGRHGDGNGKTLGFLHALCPRGHGYEGLPACDRNLNGPYTVGALFIRMMAQSCANGCSTVEQEVLKVSYLDSFGRVIKVTPTSGSSSGFGESVSTLKAYLQTCEQLTRLNLPAVALPFFCKDMDGLKKKIADLESGNTGGGSGIPSTDWDDAPEGSR